MNPRKKASPKQAPRRQSAAEELIAAALEECLPLLREYVLALEKALEAKKVAADGERVPEKHAAEARSPRKPKGPGESDHTDVLVRAHDVLFGKRPEP